MAVKEQLTDVLVEVLNKKMNRQEFLKEVAIGLLAISGASTAFKLLALNRQVSSSAGYGASSYGGASDTLNHG